MSSWLMARSPGRRGRVLIPVFTYLVLLLGQTQLLSDGSGVDLDAASSSSVVPPAEGPAANDRELLLAFVINRHGERTPDEDELSLSDEKEKLLQHIAVDGYEGLTNVGKARAYEIGKWIRRRYGPEGTAGRVLSRLYRAADLKVRTTDKDRTKMTAAVVMAAVYPPVKEQQWNDDLGKVWQPVPYTALPLSEDPLRFYSNCQRYKTLMAQAEAAAALEELAPFQQLAGELLQQTGRDFTLRPSLYQTLLDLGRSQIALGMGHPPWMDPRLEEAARLAYRIHFRSEEMKKIGGGVVLNEFVRAASAIAAGESGGQRFRMFSAHDFNIGALLEVTRLRGRETLVPEYGSLLALELYREKSTLTPTGRYTVQAVYLRQAGTADVGDGDILPFEYSDPLGHTDLDSFLQATSSYLLTDQEYYRICGITTQLENTNS